MPTHLRRPVETTLGRRVFLAALGGGGFAIAAARLSGPQIPIPPDWKQFPPLAIDEAFAPLEEFVHPFAAAVAEKLEVEILNGSAKGQRFYATATHPGVFEFEHPIHLNAGDEALMTETITFQ